MFPLTAKFEEHSRICYKMVIGIEEEEKGKKKKAAPDSTLLVLAETSDGYSRRIAVPFSIAAVYAHIERQQSVGTTSVVDFTVAELNA